VTPAQLTELRGWIEARRRTRFSALSNRRPGVNTRPSACFITTTPLDVLDLEQPGRVLPRIDLRFGRAFCGGREKLFEIHPHTLVSFSLGAPVIGVGDSTSSS